MRRGLFTISILLMLFVSSASSQTVLFFTAPDCGPCHAMYPDVEKLQADGEHIFVLNMADNPGLVKKFNVTKTPTFVIYKDGKPKGKTIGFKTLEQLRDICRYAKATTVKLIPFD